MIYSIGGGDSESKHVTRDYLNLQLRDDFHFACSIHKHAKFKYKATSLLISLKERRANQECLPIFLGEAEKFVLRLYHRVPTGTRRARWEIWFGWRMQTNTYQDDILILW